ncbi:MAG: hypothetical protein WCI77_07690 [Candidatus Omnitrophota bacterium]
MKCSVHLEREAVGACVECGLAFCEECKVTISNKNYCKKCVERVIKRTKLSERNPAIAALLSFIIAGAGQIYNGQIGKGILIFLTAWLVIPWIYGIFDAYNTAKRINNGEIVTEEPSGCLLALLFVITIPVVVAMIALLAAIAIPNFLRARLAANEAGAEAKVMTISTALESYASVHEGNYPSDEKDLTNAQPPYLGESCSNKSIKGYNYSLELNSDGYTVTAEPSSCGTTGSRIFKVETGGIKREQQCK